MEDVAGLDAHIDELYQRPPGEFTGARNALAKTLSGDEARQVKRLKKPAVVPWAINQLYWQARPVYERLLKAGQALRSAQIAALTGKNVDVRRASDAHHKALADAVERATTLAEREGSHPGAEPLARMLEALSLAADEPDHPGRFTDIVQPAGFEALTGIKLDRGSAPDPGSVARGDPDAPLRSIPPQRAENARWGRRLAGAPCAPRTAIRRSQREQNSRRAPHSGPVARAIPTTTRAEHAAPRVTGTAHTSRAPTAKEQKETARQRAREEAERRRTQAQVREAERHLERARAAEAKARTAFDRARDEVRAAEQTLAATRLGSSPARSAKP